MMRLCEFFEVSMGRTLGRFADGGKGEGYTAGIEIGSSALEVVMIDKIYNVLEAMILDWPVLPTLLPRRRLLYFRIKRAREMFGRQMVDAWHEARLDLAAQRELRICKEVGGGFITREQLDAEGRMGRFRFGRNDRAPIEMAAYIMLEELRAVSARRQRYRIREEIEISHRRTGLQVAAMVPYGR